MHLLHGDFAAGWHNYEYRWQTKMLRNARPQFFAAAMARPTHRRRAHPAACRARTRRHVAIHSLRADGRRARRESRFSKSRPNFAASSRHGAARTANRHTRKQSPRFRVAKPADFAASRFSHGPHFHSRADSVSASRAATPGNSLNTSHRIQRKTTCASAWSGRAARVTPAIRQRSIPLAQLRALTEIPGTTFYSLQKGPAAKELLDMPIEMNLVDLSAHLNDFADTAAALANLDLSSRWIPPSRISPARSASPCGSC